MEQLVAFLAVLVFAGAIDLLLVRRKLRRQSEAMQAMAARLERVAQRLLPPE